MLQRRAATTAIGRRTGAGLGLLALAVLVVIAAALHLVYGSTHVPFSSVIALVTGGQVPDMDRVILVQLRLPSTITAAAAGAALGVAGLQMQTMFANPLADPYVLGVSSGATLGVAVVLLGSSAWWGAASGFAGGSLGTTVAASLGAAAVLSLVLAVGTVVRSGTILLLLGVMIGTLVSALVMVLLAGAQPELVSQFVQWSFGSYRGTTTAQLWVLVPIVVVGLLGALALAPWMNVLQLGDRHAAALGVNVIALRVALVAVGALLAGVTTAFCGPVQFVGIAVPHIARNLFRTADHRVLLPATVLVGAALAVLVDTVVSLPGGDVLPLNAANAVVGAPIVVWVLLRSYRRTPS